MLSTHQLLMLEAEMDRNTSIPRKKWTPNEDKLLRALVHRFGTGNWRIIGEHIHGREPKQCRERWLNHLDPDVKKGRLTEDEWEIVLAAHKTYGNRHAPWSDIAKLLPGRTPNQIKNYWHSSLRLQYMGEDGEYVAKKSGDEAPVIPTLQQLHQLTQNSLYRKRSFDSLQGHESRTALAAICDDERVNGTSSHDELVSESPSLSPFNPPADEPVTGPTQHGRLSFEMPEPQLTVTHLAERPAKLQRLDVAAPVVSKAVRAPATLDSLCALAIELLEDEFSA